MEIAGIKSILQLFVSPDFTVNCHAFRTAGISAGIVVQSCFTAAFTLIRMKTKFWCMTAADVFQNFVLFSIQETMVNQVIGFGVIDDPFDGRTVNGHKELQLSDGEEMRSKSAVE